jgi:hypothetical protein
MGWVRHVARMGKEGSLHISYYENLKKRDDVEDVGIY